MQKLYYVIKSSFNQNKNGFRKNRLSSRCWTKKRNKFLIPTFIYINKNWAFSQKSVFLMSSKAIISNLNLSKRIKSKGKLFFLYCSLIIRHLLSFKGLARLVLISRQLPLFRWNKRRYFYFSLRVYYYYYIEMYIWLQ